MRALAGFLSAAVVGVSLQVSPAVAADYSVPPVVKQARVAKVKNPYCGCKCGCPVVTLVRHREVLMGFPHTFDPRVDNEPRYFYGRMRTWPRYARAVPAY
jgi:hypothetical protein